MANGKAMTVGEMASLFLDPATPVRIDAFDGSHFGPADADLKVNVATPNCMYQLLAHPSEIGIVRAYILGDLGVEGIDYADPYPAMRKLISLSKYVKPLTPASIARVSAGILSHGFKKPPVPSTEGPSKFARIKRGLMPHTEKADSETVSDGDLGAPGFIESCIHDAGFNVVHQENLRQHYALTLHHWNQNLSEHWDDAVKQVGFERAKVWGMYMAACALNFELDGIQIHQFLAAKPDRVGHPDGKWYPLRQWWQA